MHIKLAVAGGVALVAYLALFTIPRTSTLATPATPATPVTRPRRSGFPIGRAGLWERKPAAAPSVTVPAPAEEPPWASYTFDDLDEFEQAWLIMWRDSWGMPVHLWDRSAVNHVEDQTQMALALISIDPETLASQYSMSVDQIRSSVVELQHFTERHPELNAADRYLIGRIEEAASWIQPGSAFQSWFPSWWPF